MSRGLGAQQQAIMSVIRDLSRGVGMVVAHPDMPEAQKSAARRAAHSLAAQGLVRLEYRPWRGRKRLTAFKVTPELSLCVKRPSTSGEP